ncbi:universal stress protein [Aestuariibaculum suncheonense]|uniref:Universal stress protein n=1 Tax=Aestuariibaculum suncheonense TaxID=1028745 RepID=A0A8J6QDP0_9FLAO|nr:universal stress protein [Aestuariibaculum suncheonense]MBD0835158.1 universal stress protein [Aestuariibaculum suncheonense]
MKTILLPTDFSENSINAIHYALDMFKDESCNFYILNVQKVSSYVSDNLMMGSPMGMVYDSIVEAAKVSVDKMIVKLTQEYKNDKHEFFSMVDYDNFTDAINQTVINNGIDLIVMGTKGATGLSQVVFGSNTVRVLKHVKVPVLVVPEHCKYTGLKDVAFTTSFQSLYNMDELELLNEIIIKNNSKLTVLHVVLEHAEATELFQDVDFFNENFDDVSYKMIETNVQDVFDAVQGYITNNDVKLITMTNKKHSFLDNVFKKHQVDDFAFRINIPLLVLPKRM